MRQVLIAAATIIAASAAVAQAQTADRYGGVGTYAAPMPQPQTARVLSWSGKTVPAQSPPQQGGYGYPQYFQAKPAYGAQLGPAPYAQSRGAPPPPYAVERRAQMYPQARPQAQYAYPQPQYAQPQPQYAQPQYAPQPQQTYPQQAYPQQPYPAAYPSPYQAQPYYAPAPRAAPNAPGSSATAPTGVYPANTVPPQLAYPMAVPPQQAQPLVGNPPAPPTSIYAPPPQATEGTRLSDPTDPRQPQRVAMNDAQGPAPMARLYSLHRQFGLQPDPTPLPASDEDRQSVELVSAIDSGVGGEPADETTRNRVVSTKAKAGTAVLRGARAPDSDTN